MAFGMDFGRQVDHRTLSEGQFSEDLSLRRILGQVLGWLGVGLYASEIRVFAALE